MLQAGGRAFRQGTAATEKFRLIQALSERFSIAWLCKQLGVARCGFYAWRQRQRNLGPRAMENVAINAQVQTVLDRYRGFYSSRRVNQELDTAALK